MDSRRSRPSNSLEPVAVQHPIIRTHVYWCVSVPRRGRGTESVPSLSSVPERDVLRAIIIRVHLVPALRTTEVFAVAVLLVGEPTVRPRAPLARVVRRDLHHRDAAFRRFVRNVLVQASERPEVVPLGCGSRSRMSVSPSNTITSQSISRASVTISLAIVWRYCFRHASSRLPRRSMAL